MKTELVENSGSLLENHTHITSSFDLSKGSNDGVITKLALDNVLNHSIKGFRKNYLNENNLNVINGMGVTLGDSIIGINALDCIKKINKNIQITLIRPATCHSYVEEIYSIASNLIDRLEYMPYDIKRLRRDAVNIDIGNQLYWHDFNNLEMHDFFLKNLGVDFESIPDNWKCNYWLKDSLPKDANNKNQYVLFCPKASTSLRSIPERFHYQIIDNLYTSFDLPVHGFSPITHPMYKDISKMCSNTADFIKAIAHAQHVYTCDSSALHVASGYDIPTTCIFTAINPVLRSRYYKNCKSIYIGDEITQNLHESEDPAIIEHVVSRFEAFYEKI
ncbi:glycosyltransferase family 9 protein [Klebsiella pneumoniae]